jgi:hypothetical protein
VDGTFFAVACFPPGKVVDVIGACRAVVSGAYFNVVVSPITAAAVTGRRASGTFEIAFAVDGAFFAVDFSTGLCGDRGAWIAAVLGLCGDLVGPCWRAGFATLRRACGPCVPIAFAVDGTSTAIYLFGLIVLSGAVGRGAWIAAVVFLCGDRVGPCWLAVLATRRLLARGPCVPIAFAVDGALGWVSAGGWGGVGCGVVGVLRAHMATFNQAAIFFPVALTTVVATATATAACAARFAVTRGLGVSTLARALVTGADFVANSGSTITLVARVAGMGCWSRIWCGVGRGTAAATAAAPS